MAPTLRQLIAERKGYLKELKSFLKECDTNLERIERKYKSLLARKDKVPELRDLEVLADLNVEFDAACTRYDNLFTEVLYAFERF